MDGWSEGGREDGRKGRRQGEQVRFFNHQKQSYLEPFRRQMYSLKKLLTAIVTK